MKKCGKSYAALLSASAAVAVAPPDAVAGGFFNANQTATAAGSAVAGATADAANAGTVFYNPAGMVVLGHSEALLASGLILSDASFENGGTIDAAGLPVRGNTTVKTTPVVLSSLFGVASLNDRVALGLGLSVPFGQQTKYDDQWVGRYEVQQVSLQTIGIRPAVAVRVASWLSIGAAIDVQSVDFKRANAIDFGSLLFGLGVPGAVPEASDGRLSVALNGWGVGYDLGVVLEPLESLRVGLNFRSGVRTALSGTAIFNVPAAAAPLTAGGAFQNTIAHSRLNTPEIVSLGIVYRASEHWVLLGDLSWQQWSDFQQLTLDFDNPTSPLTQALHWQDSIRAAIGAVYTIDNDYDVRAGFAYDQSPVPDAFRTPDLPQADTVAMAAGVTRHFGQRVSFTLSYSYNHSLPAQINATNPVSGTVAGRANEDVHAVGLEAQFRF